ncbi:MAG: RNA 3'-terminal phosphate cyclase [Anaerolineae bacterium]|nr:RNA 3'-terminal phosphate cyclase [Anaerolineae bacterium]MDH7474543.1 RNA 3'-terminal phosphate cyclase [Anaerolineae bacterium]
MQTNEILIIDGSYGEGGGQVLRTALSLAALLGRAVRLVNIRAGRPKPGLQAQHLTSVRAVARICNAEVERAKLGSQELTFIPRTAPQAGNYALDVADARQGGSAGAASLVFQTLLLPLALAGGQSRLNIRGGTHVEWSPPFDYLKRVYLPTLARMGVQAKVHLEKWGWYPVGGGEMTAVIEGIGGEETTGGERNLRCLQGLTLTERGQLLRLRGLSATSNLPRHIAQRQQRQTLQTLRERGFNPHVEVVDDAPSKGQGTVVFLWAEFENVVAGFTAYGRLGKRAEEVAEEACRQFLAYYDSGAALDPHLADQLILPLALAAGESAFTTSQITEHLLTNVWVVEQFLGPRFKLEGERGKAGRVRIV